MLTRYLSIIPVLCLVACGADPADDAAATEGPTGAEAGTAGGDDGAMPDEGVDDGRDDEGMADDNDDNDDGVDDSTDPTDDDDGSDDATDTGPVGGPAGSCGMGGGTGEILQITLDSPERWYLIGAHDTDEPLPLVLAFHGDEGDPFNSTRYIWGSYWEQQQPPFIAVMTKCPGCTSWYQDDTSANADYVWDVLADVAANHNVDVSRIYAVGYSGGSEFLAIHGWEFQDVFAGIQWTCGGNAYTPYMAPSRPDCKVRGRIVISQDDFLWEGSQNLLARLQNEGHEHEYVDAQCSGHCCDTPDDNVGAWEWFQTVTKCGAEVPGECAELDALPPQAYGPGPARTLVNRGSSRTNERAVPIVAPPSFSLAVQRFDDAIATLQRLEGRHAEPAELAAPLRDALAAYDTMLASAHDEGPDAAAVMQRRHPTLRRFMAALR